MHLSLLGFPIANDSQYGGTYKGPDQVRSHAAAVRSGERAQPLSHSAVASTALRMSQADSTETALPIQDSLSCEQSANKRHKCNAWATTSRDQSDDPCAQQQTDDGMSGSHKSEQTMLEKAQGSCELPEAGSSCSAELKVPQDLQDDMCLNCPNLIPPGYPTDIYPLWLHAQSYTCERWSFMCPKPVWASPDWAAPTK